MASVGRAICARPARPVSMADIWEIKELSSGGLRLLCLPGVGGRLWDVMFEGRSLLFQNPDLAGIIFDIAKLSELPTRSPQFAFPLWGGEKTWIAPDTAWPDGGPYPVLDSGPYHLISGDDRRLTMLSEPCPVSGLQIERCVTLDSGRSWSIHHRVLNVGSRKRFAGIWSVMMLHRPAQIGVDIGRNAVVTPVFGDASQQHEIRESGAVIDCSAAKEFKLGTHNPAGRSFLRLIAEDKTLWLACSTVPASGDDQFAHGHNFEVFNSADYSYCEAEWHAPARHLSPGESMSFTQKFSLWSDLDEVAEDDIAPRELELVKCMS